MIFESITINKDSDVPIYRQIADNIKELIALDRIDMAKPLPPIRKLAQGLSLNPSTVVKAYRLLEKEGFISTTAGSGTYVTALGIKQRESKPMIYYEFEEAGLGAGHLEVGIDAINLSSTSSTPSLFPVQDFKESINFVIERDGGDVFGYQESKGYLPLRIAISNYLSNYDISAHEDSIQVISGAQQGIDILSKSLIGYRDSVIVEIPTYVGAISSFKARGANIEGVNNTPRGIDLDNLEKTLRTKRPKLIYTMPNFHNPTGYCYDLSTKRNLLFLAQKYNLTIIEDDFASELHFEEEHLPTLKSLDKDERVIYIKSFSKVFAPGLRLAFMLYPKRFSREIIMAKHSSDISTSGLIQRAFEHYLNQGRWKEHIQGLKAVYKERCHSLMGYIDNNMKQHMDYHRPAGGVNLWIELTNGYSANELHIEARRRNVIIVPGSAFHPENIDIPNLRVSFSEVKGPNLIKAMEIIKGILEGPKYRQQKILLKPLI